MIVVVIIGILAGIAVPKFSGARRKAYIAAMRSDLRNLISAEELFFSDSSRYSAQPSSMKYRSSSGDVVSIVTGPGFWSATAAHAQVPDLSCAIAMNTDNPLSPDVPDGMTLCRTSGAAGATGK
jgi:type II secretory pathway pseudopilin PulG